LKWVLIITTFYAPHAPIAITEQFVHSEQACYEKMRSYEERFDAAAKASVELGLNAGFGYTMRCAKREQRQ
jgi:hypothetical protein